MITFIIAFFIIPCRITILMIGSLILLQVFIINSIPPGNNEKGTTTRKMSLAHQPIRWRLQSMHLAIWSPPLIIYVISVDSTHHLHPQEFWESHRRVLQRLSCGCWSWWWWTRWTPCRVTSCFCQTGKNQSLLYGDIQRKYSLSSKLLFSLQTTIAMSVIIRLVQKGMEIALPRWENMSRKKSWTQTMITAIMF